MTADSPVKTALPPPKFSAGDIKGKDQLSPVWDAGVREQVKYAMREDQEFSGRIGAKASGRDVTVHTFPEVRGRMPGFSFHVQ